MNLHTCFLYAFSFFIVGSINCKAQKEENRNSVSILIQDYPEGIYGTYQDFLDKNAINLGDAIERRHIIGMTKKVIDKNTQADHVFFYNNRNNTKMNNYFAISYNGNLYIQERQIQKLASKEDRNQSAEAPNSYHRVLKDGRFLYLEGDFSNAWSKGFAYSGGAVGGVIGSSLNSAKGIVFDFETNKFNFIRTCEDMNELLEKYNVEKLICKNKKIDILSVRENIDKIIK